jgi:uncharacterized protein YndB with AHSA1/START domain
MASQTTVERASDTELVVSRTFNGPARLVFSAWTQPEYLMRWWAPTSFGVKMLACEVDLQVGGRFRYVFQASEGGPMTFSGIYQEITPPSRLVYAMYFLPTPEFKECKEGEVLVTVTFEERDGKTFLRSHERYPSKEVLDGAIATGMEAGVHVTWDQLDELVATLTRAS